MATIVSTKPIVREDLPEALPAIWGRPPAPAAFVPRLQPITVVRPEEYDEPAGPPIRWGPLLIDLQRRYGAARGLYRVWNDAEYRFYRSNVAPPAAGDTPFATNATLPHTPVDTYADGTWYVSVTRFNGVLESGFLPIGPRGETYLRLVISSGAVLPTPPSVPLGARLEARPGGVLRVLAFYPGVADGANRADRWGMAYTTNGSTPAVGAATITRLMSGSGLEVLSYDLPAQPNATVVKVQLQTMRGTTVYSDASAVLSATVSTAGPKFPQDLVSWPGGIPAGGA